MADCYNHPWYIMMLDKNTPGAKKARPSRKHQLVLIIFIHATKKSDIWWRPRPKLFASNNVRSISHIYFKLQKVQSLILAVQQFEHN